MPGWKKAKLSTTRVPGVVKKLAASGSEKFMFGVKLGADEGTVDGEWLKKNILSGNIADNIELIDVAPKDVFDKGHLAGSINIHAEKLGAKKLYSVLPKNKVSIFYCTSGARSLEAWMKLNNKKYDVSKVYYFDANINCNKKGICKIDANEPID